MDKLKIIEKIMRIKKKYGIKKYIDKFDFKFDYNKEANKHSKCGGSYRKGVVFDSSGAICRMFINFTTSKLDKHS
jgi:hypothetical protein